MILRVAFADGAGPLGYRGCQRVKGPVQQLKIAILLLYKVCQLRLLRLKSRKVQTSLTAVPAKA